MNIYFDKEPDKSQKPIDHPPHKTYKVSLDNIIPGLFKPFNEDELYDSPTKEIG